MTTDHSHVMPATCMMHQTARSGLGRVRQKLESGKDVTIVFLGGSITSGAQASNMNVTSYRARTTQWIRDRYPKTNLTSINAGIGGTGSDLGVFRCQSDVLSHKPDLVFVEFAVNDGKMNDRQSMECFEGLLRQLYGQANRPDICILYTLDRAHLPLWHAHKLSPRAATQERLAEHYALPSVRLAQGIADRILHDQVQWDELMNDSVHPSDAGHEAYAQVLITAMDQLFEQPSLSHDMPCPLVSDRYVTSRMQDLPCHAQGWTWTQLENLGGWDCFNGLLMAEEPDAELTLPFHGKLVGLFYQLGPDTGNLLYRIDDGPEQMLAPFDKWAADCRRPQYRILSDQLVNGPHILKLRIADSRDARSNGTWTRLAQLLVG